MSVAQKHAKLVEKLYKLTEQRKLSWEEDGWGEEYKAPVSNWFVTIANGRRGARPIVVIKLQDSSGTDIDVFNDEDLGGIVPAITQHDNYYPIMSDLYNAAKRAATGADAAIDSILDALDDDLDEI